LKNALQSDRPRGRTKGVISVAQVKQQLPNEGREVRKRKAWAGNEGRGKENETGDERRTSRGGYDQERATIKETVKEGKGEKRA